MPRKHRHRQGALGHGPPWAPKAPFAIVGALQSRMCLQGNIVGGRLEAPTNYEKSIRKVPPCAYNENLVGGSNEEMSLPKVPSMTTVWRPPWVKWCPPNPSPPFAFF